MCQFHYVFFSFPGALQIANSEAEDAGKYECVAENSLGTEFSQATQLYVKGKFPHSFRLSFSFCFYQVLLC